MLPNVAAQVSAGFLLAVKDIYAVLAWLAAISKHMVTVSSPLHSAAPDNLPRRPSQGEVMDHVERSVVCEAVEKYAVNLEDKPTKIGI